MTPKESKNMPKNFISVGSIYKSRFSEDKPAIRFKEQIITYGQLDEQVVSYANYLKSQGLQSDDKVILDMGNCPAFLYTYLGVVRNAAIIVPVNPMLTLHELTYVAKDSDAKYIVIGEDVMTSHNFTAESLTEALGLRVIVADAALSAEIALAPREQFDLAPDEDDISTFLYTSGTTGNPKAAMLSHKNLAGNAGQSEEFWEVTDQDSIMCVLPMFHVFSFTLCVLLPLKAGCTISLIESFAPKTVIAELLEKEISIFMGVPTMLMVLTDIMKKENIRFPKLRIAAYGGASTPLQLFNTMVELGIPPAEGFGLTEGSPAVLLNPAGKGRPLSCGVPISDVECRIVDEDDHDVPVGEVGELAFRGPNLMKGYYNRPEETEASMRGGWFHTGDLAKKDADDYYYIVDRKKDMVVVSGLNVYPREVEEILYKHPEIKDAAVIGVPDKLRGEVVIAYIVLKDPAKNIRHKEILRWLREYLAVYKLPRRIVVIDDLPRNSTGKILKRVLKEQVLEAK
jgi:long-chain acyl-CoA synthetase